jgi:hypothetical protein
MGQGGAPSASAQTSETALEILSPRSGARVDAPFSVNYRVACPPEGCAGFAYLHVSVAGVDPLIAIDVPIDAMTGTIEIPADKRMTGLRDLTFTLASPDREPLEWPAASVTIRDLTIAGPRAQ